MKPPRLSTPAMISVVVVSSTSRSGIDGSAGVGKREARAAGAAAGRHHGRRPVRHPAERAGCPHQGQRSQPSAPDCPRRCRPGNRRHPCHAGRQTAAGTQAGRREGNAGRWAVRPPVGQPQAHVRVSARRCRRPSTSMENSFRSSRLSCQCSTAASFSASRAEVASSKMKIVAFAPWFMGAN